MNLGGNIKKLRELKNYTQQHLADELGLSLSGYGKIERDQTEITLGRLKKIADILGLELCALINFEDSDLFKSSQIISHKITNGHQLSNPNEFQEKLIQKYKDENEYLKELVRQILKKEYL